MGRKEGNRDVVTLVESNSPALKLMLTNAILVYARGEFVAFVLKLSHFVISYRNTCRSPFKVNMICTVSICRIKNRQNILISAV